MKTAFHYAIAFIGTIVCAGAVYAADMPDTGRTVSGAPLGTNVQGNANDKNVEGDRSEDAEGNTSHDIYGNKTGTEKSK